MTTKPQEAALTRGFARQFAIKQSEARRHLAAADWNYMKAYESLLASIREMRNKQ